VPHQFNGFLVAAENVEHDTRHKRVCKGCHAAPVLRADGRRLACTDADVQQLVGRSYIAVSPEQDARSVAAGYAIDAAYLFQLRVREQRKNLW
jgi:hypothetical protein